MTGTAIIEYLEEIKTAQRRRRVDFWGNQYTIKPLLVDAIFGDGGQMIALQPLATRPDRYLVRVDNRQELEGDEWVDLLGEIQEAIENQFGPAEWTDDNDKLRHENWPSPDWNCGCGWWTVEHFLNLAETL